MNCPHDPDFECPHDPCAGGGEEARCDFVRRYIRRNLEAQAAQEAERRRPPGLAAMAGNLARAVVAHVADGMAHAPPEVRDERERACRACPKLDREADRCLECGCTNMPLKRSWASSACPLAEPRWGAVPG